MGNRLANEAGLNGQFLSLKGQIAGHLSGAREKRYTRSGVPRSCD